MSSPLVSIVIPVFNQWRYTEECLKSLRANAPSEISFEVVVVDNASTDDTAQGLQKWQKEWPVIKVETLPMNTGFSPACNRGAEISRGKYLLFLNNDTIAQPGWLLPLVQELQQPGVGIVGPKLVYPDGKRINHAGYVFGMGSFYAIYHNHDASAPEVNKRRDYQALLGACILLPRDLFFSVGQFSLDGLEDIDLCLKIKTKGLVSRYVPTSTVYHHGSVTLSNSLPGSFPVTSQVGFGERWNNYLIGWDDYAFYLEDGIWPGPSGGEFNSSAQQRVAASMAELMEAYQMRAKGELEAALSHGQKALTLWPKNPMALLLRCQIFESTNHKALISKDLLDFGELSFCRGPVLQELLRIIAQST